MNEKIENGITNLPVDRMEEIATILNVLLESILSCGNQLFNITDNHNNKIVGHIENLYEANKELLEKQVTLLQEQNAILLKTVEALTQKAHTGTSET